MSDIRHAAAPRLHLTLQPLEDRLTPALLFGPSQPLTAGTGPQAVATGDFNGDGRVDVAAANFGGNMVSVLLNTTVPGTTTAVFAPRVDFPTGAGAQSVAVADFNDDGRLDLAIANANANSVSILLNTTPAGSNTVSFAPRLDLGVGTNPQSVAVGDFNLDGRVDVAAANFGSNTVSVLRNTTTPGAATATFAARLDLALGNGPQSVAVGDFDGDGRLDLVTANATANTVSVARNITLTGPAPSFTRQDYAVGNGPQSVAVGDFDGDGRLDITTANATAGTVSVLRNVTASGFAPAFTASFNYAVGGAPVSVTVGDYDGDGRSDVATANATDNTVSLLRNTTPAGGVPTLSLQQVYNVGVGAKSVTAADFSGNGLLDLVTANPTPNTLSLLPNTSTNVAVTGPVVVGQFGTTGVWRFNRLTGTWVNLTTSNATALATAPNGNIVANFGPNGLWYYNAATVTWTQINTVEASALAIDRLGNAHVNFAGFGTYVYRLATGQYAQLLGTGATANKLLVSANGDVFADFTGFGLFRYRSTTGWVQLNGNSTLALAVGANGDLAASFAGFGTYRFTQATGFNLINGVDATALAVGGNGSIAASFPGFGVAQYVQYANGWRTIGPGTQADSLAVDWNGHVYAQLNGFGVWEFDPIGLWNARRFVNATFLSLA